MLPSSPTMEGFRAAIHQPAVSFAEVIWRWAFGAAAAVLLLFSCFEYLDTLPVRYGDLLFLRSGQPFLVSRALGDLFTGSGERFVLTLLIVLPSLAMFWIVAASAGRVASIQRLLEHFRAGPLPGIKVPLPCPGIRSLFGLNFFRAALALAALSGLAGSTILAGFASTDAKPQPGLAFMLFLPLAFLVVVFWSTLNWFLSLAPVFVVSQGQDTFGSLSAAVDFCRRKANALVWSSTVFGLLHFLAFILAASIAFLPLMLLGTVPRALVFLGVVLVTLAYFAAVDFLYVGRLASYVAILNAPDVPPAWTEPIAPQSTQPSAVSLQPTTTVDQAETILSDTPRPSTPPSPADDDILSDIPSRND